MTDDLAHADLSISHIRPVEAFSIKKNNRQLIRRAGIKSLRSTVIWCFVALVSLIVNQLLGLVCLFGAILQLRASYRWLAMTRVLNESEREKWSRRVKSLTTLVVLVGLTHIAYTVAFIVLWIVSAECGTF